MFDAILRISRLETRAANVDIRRVPLAELLTDLAETFGAVAEDKGQTLTVTPVNPSLVIQTDAGMLAQMLANVIQNAISHCPADTAITLGAAALGDTLELHVRDTGPGIPVAERDRVFELFHQVDPNRAKGGNGLGMALVKAITERPGARLRLLDAGPGLLVEIEMDLLPASGAPV